jgi:hypothetical protein
MLCSTVMETSAPPPFPPMPSDYYRRQAERVRNLSQVATTAAIREHLADVAIQYEQLAEEADAACRNPLCT